MSMMTSYTIRSEVTPVENPMRLLPGFRFHPTDEEIVVHYLIPKVMNIEFSAVAIGHVDFNKCEPWDLPKVGYTGDTTERYYYCLRDKKYPTGLRTNRATKAGYWKATGKDREIFMENTDSKVLVGMKKTLVFYKGRAPRGEKTNWVMHEFRLHSQFNKLPKDDYGWVVSRVFHKNADGNNNVKTKRLTSDDSLSMSEHEHELMINGNEYDHSLPYLSNHQLQDLKLASTIEPSDEDQLLYSTDPYYYCPKQPETTLIQTHGSTYNGADDDEDGSVLKSFNFKVEECFAFNNNAGNGFSSYNADIGNNGNNVETLYSNDLISDELHGTFLPSTIGSVQDLSNMWDV